MLRTFLRQSLVVLAAVALYLPIALYYGDSVQALTISLPNNCTLSVDGQGNGNVTCSSGGGGSFSCSMSASVANPSATTVETFTATCSNAGGTVSYNNWANVTGGNCPGPTGSGNKATLQAPGSAVGPCTYSVTATDSASPSSPATPQTSLTYTSGGGGGGNLDLSACTNMGLNPIVVNVAWPTAAQGNQTVVRPGTFGGNDALIVQFTTSSVTSVNTKGNISAVEFGGATTPRAGAFSASPCDFVGGLQKFGSTSFTTFNGWNPSFSFTLFNPVKNYAVLSPNTPYYLNITNFVPAPPPTGGTQNCPPYAPYVNCPMQITLSIPSGT